MIARWAETHEQATDAVAAALPLPSHFGRRIAIRWLGHVEANNGATLEEIVRAASEAERAAWEGDVRDGLNHVHGPDAGCDALCMDAARGFHFDIPAFFSALAIEAVGVKKCTCVRGESCGDCVPSWFDTHARFTVTSRPRVVKSAFPPYFNFVNDGAFELPPLVIAE